MAGYFATLEGLDGTGKSTVIGYVKQQLITNRHVVFTREPGGTDIAEQMRQIALNGQDMDPVTEALIIAAGRADHVSRVIQPALDRGDLVISDRFYDSSVAYQGFARGAGFDRVLELNLWAAKGLRPDVTFYIDSSPEESLQRISKKPDRLERFGIELQRKVAEGYRMLIEKYPERFVVFEKGMALPDIASKLIQVLNEKLV